MGLHRSVAVLVFHFELGFWVIMAILLISRLLGKKEKVMPLAFGNTLFDLSQESTKYQSNH